MYILFSFILVRVIYLIVEIIERGADHERD